MSKFFLILMLMGVKIYGMEKEYLKLQDCNNKKFREKSAIALQCRIISRVLHDAPFVAGGIDVVFTENEEICRKNIKAVFSCIQNSEACQRVPLPITFHVANYLEAPDYVMRVLALRMYKNHILRDFRDEWLQRNENYFCFNSVKKLMAQEKLDIAQCLTEPLFIDGEKYFALDLSHRNLDLIDGIEDLPIDQSIIYLLVLNNNNLRALNVPYLRTIFKNLSCINASNNAIKKPIIGALNTGFTLNLAQNPIRDLCELKRQGTCVLDITGHQLSEVSKARLDKEFKKEFLDLFEAIQEKDKDPRVTMVCWGALVGGLFGFLHWNRSIFVYSALFNANKCSNYDI